MYQVETRPAAMTNARRSASDGTCTRPPAASNTAIASAARSRASASVRTRQFVEAGAQQPLQVRGKPPVRLLVHQPQCRPVAVAVLRQIRQIILQSGSHEIDDTIRRPADSSRCQGGGKLRPRRGFGSGSKRAGPGDLDGGIGGPQSESLYVAGRSDGPRGGCDAAPAAGASERHQPQPGPVQKRVAHPSEENAAEHQRDHFVRFEQVRHVEDMQLRHEAADLGHRRSVDVDRSRLQRRQALGRRVAACTADIDLDCDPPPRERLDQRLEPYRFRRVHGRSRQHHRDGMGTIRNRCSTSDLCFARHTGRARNQAGQHRDRETYSPTGQCSTSISVIGKCFGFPVASTAAVACAAAATRQSACDSVVPRAANRRRHSPACRPSGRPMGTTRRPSKRSSAAEDLHPVATRGRPPPR